MPTGRPTERELLSPGGKRYLLVIAIDRYAHLTPLESSVRDAEAIIEVLTGSYCFEEGPNLITLFNEDATLERIKRTLARLGALIEPRDSLFVLFCGHGRRFEDKGGQRRGALAPVDARPGDPLSYLQNYELEGLLESIHAFHLNLIVDACFSGLIVRDRGDEDIPQGTREEKQEKYGRMLQKRSRWILTAGDDERVEDGGPDRNSPFAYSILRTLRRHPDDFLTFRQFGNRVCELTVSTARRNIYPKLGTFRGHEGGEWVFQRRRDEEKDWSILSRARDVGDYLAFKKLYPGSARIEPTFQKSLDLQRAEKNREMLEKPTLPPTLERAKIATTGEEKDQAFSDMLVVLDKMAWEQAVRDNSLLSYWRYLRLEEEPIYRVEARREVARRLPLYGGGLLLVLLAVLLVDYWWPVPSPSPPFDWVEVEGGTFTMGQPDPDIGCIGCTADEGPPVQREVATFFLTRHEITNRQYADFLLAYQSDTVKAGRYRGRRLLYPQPDFGLVKENGAWRPVAGGENTPVTYVTWYGAEAFARFYQSRLPTEAEWEYAAQGGRKAADSRFSGGEEAGGVAWSLENSGGRPRPVGAGKPNELGLYDLSGNVWEWTADVYLPYRRERLLVEGPDRMVLRGGAWDRDSLDCRVTSRHSMAPAERDYDVGFRIVWPGQ